VAKELIPSRMLDKESLERSCKVGALKAPAHIHVSGACGTGMASVLILLKELGFYVSGSDKAFYPPMGEIVRKTADKVFEGYSAENLQERPALVVIGNSLSRNNPEVEYVLANDIPFASMPEVFAGLLIGTRELCPTSIVVSGTHGKTTTSAAVTSMFDHAGWRPGYFIGGVPKNLSAGIRPVDTSIPKEKRVVVLEGDEYDSAFFAKYSKFHSYRPDIALVTSLEFDHADIYNSIEEIGEQFSAFVKRVPKEGAILVADSGDYLQALTKKWKSDSEIKARIFVYGESSDCDFQLVSRSAIPVTKGSGQKFEARLQNTRVAIKTSLGGPQNAWNLLATAAIGHLKGLDANEIASGIASFEGVLRRQHVIADTKGIVVLEDFAHHPTAVDLTLKGIKEQYPEKRVVAVFEPRSNTSRRGFFQEQYANSFSAADLVLIQEVGDAGGYSATAAPVVALDVAKIAADISLKGIPAHTRKTIDEILLFLKKELRDGDLVVLMSNGDFGGLPKKLPELLKDLR